MDPKRGSFQSRNGHIWRYGQKEQIWRSRSWGSGKVGQKVAKTRNQGDFGKSGIYGLYRPYCGKGSFWVQKGSYLEIWGKKGHLGQKAY